MEQKYNEFKVVPKIDKDGNRIIKKGFLQFEEKTLTKRGHVVISERDAEVNNLQTQFTMLHYELAKETKSEKRLALEAEAEKLGITFRANIGDDNLEAKINDAKK